MATIILFILKPLLKLIPISFVFNTNNHSCFTGLKQCRKLRTTLLTKILPFTKSP